MSTHALPALHRIPASFIRHSRPCAASLSFFCTTNETFSYLATYLRIVNRRSLDTDERALNQTPAANDTRLSMPLRLKYRF